MIIDEKNHLLHIGILRRSGRYPWGSGDTTLARSRSFLEMTEALRRKKVSDVDIAKGFGMSTTDLRRARTLAKSETLAADIAEAHRLKSKGMSNTAIGKQMGKPESTVRSLLEPGRKDKLKVLDTTSNMLREQVERKKYIDVGAGVHLHLGISETKLGAAVARLRDEGYEVHTIAVDQLGTANKTKTKVLTKPGTTYREVKANAGQIQQIMDFSPDGGRSYFGIQPPISISSKRLKVRYAEEGGTDADGVIYVRRGVDDLSMGKSQYAQVRIAIDGTHYAKGMAIYKDDLPKGVDIVFNTNKSDTGNKLDALKPLKRDKDGNVDLDNPFGSVVRQLPKIDKDGFEIPNTVRSAMNIVNEEGSWGKWSKTLSSQFLSKQSASLAKGQLGLAYDRKKAELDEILSLTNPAVRRELLRSYSDDADSAAVHLKAASINRQGTFVIMPVNSMRPTEVYAPKYRDGERVVLVRHPHGGVFEIPELVVNNRHPEAKKLLGQAPDAIGIHHSVAEKLSGADFDGDTVLVIPNNNRKIRHAPMLEGLKGFDPKAQYPEYPGMKLMDSVTKGFEMGDISNLITDMTIQGASNDELARAVRHSMVVIDAEKHKLNWKQSALDNGIASLKKKYQGKSNGGASTLISRASSRQDVHRRKPRSAADDGPIDRATGKKVYTYEPGYINKKGKLTFATQKSTKLAETDDAHTLSSGTVIEKIYGDHSNRLKNLANVARKEMIETKSIPYSPSAKIVYAKQVESLNRKLREAQRNAPLERQAQIFAGEVYRQKKASNPEMDKDEKKKVKFLALREARDRFNAGKDRVYIEDDEWEAIQAGAITNNKLTDILRNADLDRVKELATPRVKIAMTPIKQRRAEAMMASGHTYAEIADALGVSVSTLSRTLSPE